MTKTSFAPSRRYFAVVTTLAVFFWGMVVLSRWLPADRATAARAVEQVSGEVETAQREYQRAQENLGQARLRAATAKKEFDDFLSTHFEGHRETLEHLRAAVARQGAAPADGQTAPEPKAQTVNPRFRELSTNLHDLELRRSQLLEKLTSAHPEVQEIDAKIVDAQRALHAASETIAPPADSSTEGLQLPGAGRRAQQLLADNQQIERQQIERQREMIAGYEKARARLQKAETDWHQASMLERRAAEHQASLLAQVAQRAVPSTRRQAAGHWPILALVASLALVAGAAVALAGRRKATTFTTIEDVEATLRIPVIGVIADATTRAMNPRRRNLARGMMLLGELTLAVFLFSLIALTIDNLSFLPALLADPVAGFARGLNRLVSMSSG